MDTERIHWSWSDCVTTTYPTAFTTICSSNPYKSMILEIEKDNEIERLADITSIYRRYGSFKDEIKKNEIYGNGIGMIIGDNFQDIKEKLRELLQ